MAARAKLTDEQREYFSTLEGFAVGILGYGSLYEWEKDFFSAVERHDSRTSARTCNGAGKSSRLIPACALWQAAEQGCHHHGVRLSAEASTLAAYVEARKAV